MRFTLNGSFLTGGGWEEFLDLSSQSLRALGIKQVTQIGPGDDYIVRSARNAILERPELLTDHSFDPIAAHSVADLLAHGYTQPRWSFCLRTAGEYVQHQIAVSLRFTGAVDAVEIRATGKSATTRLVPARSQGQAERRRRPFLRRRLSIALPPREELRTRKPCVLERLRFLGW